MSCTEAEAKTKWCPFYRVATSGGDPYKMDNRPLEYTPTDDPVISATNPPWRATGGIQPQANCLGNRCMAWQWVTPEYQCLDRAPDEPDAWYLPKNGWNKVTEDDRCPSCMKRLTIKAPHYWRKNEPRSGQCGLANK